MTQTKNLRPIVMLLVEDNPGDVRLTREALKENKIEVNLQVVEDGEQASDYIFQRGEFADAEPPDIILLDLNLPKKDGREVLEEIKGDPRLKRIPVVVLTMSKAEEDILRAYDLHANCYISKPIDLPQFIQVVKTIEDFWFTIVRLPSDGTLIS
jgi:CheY-like chemotaxis protein